MGMKKSIMGMALSLPLMAMMAEQGMMITEEPSKPRRIPQPQIKDPNEGLGISVDYLNQYARILNGTSKLGMVKQTRIKEKIEAYAERLIKYYELNPVTL